MDNSVLLLVTEKVLLGDPTNADEKLCAAVNSNERKKITLIILMVLDSMDICELTVLKY